MPPGNSTSKGLWSKTEGHHLIVANSSSNLTQSPIMVVIRQDHITPKGMLLAFCKTIGCLNHLFTRTFYAQLQLYTEIHCFLFTVSAMYLECPAKRIYFTGSVETRLKFQFGLSVKIHNHGKCECVVDTASTQLHKASIIDTL